MFEVLKTEGHARRCRFETVHGVIETPAFMNVATSAAIKGGLSAYDLVGLKSQVALCNTYHLHLRPGDALIRELGGLRRFMGWSGPVLTDSGGFQVFSLAKLRKISDEGVSFRSHIDGQAVFMGPEESIRIQSNLGSTISMAFDECVANPAEYDYAKNSCERTERWLIRSREEMTRLNASGSAINPAQMLFGINQGSIYDDLRIENMRRIASLGLEGYAIGGLAVGESAEQMYHVIEAVEPFMPVEKPRYLMGVGTPANILEAVSRGIDLFDCVMPSRNARHAHVFTHLGKINLNNAKYERDVSPIDPQCACPVCQRYSRAYLRHLFKAGEVLALRLCVAHNLFFYNTLMEDIRRAISDGRFESFKNEAAERLDWRI
ncbi:MAG: tRNA guanosine(34) transglycosylase Tgt [Clostridia bacterium]|nr:tRNA guanosine(34) transglycosylase Tgt [Clostridia bacterium]